MHRPDNHRRSMRLARYDYSQAGAYFVTLCSYRRVSLFGEVTGGEMLLNQYGNVAAECWEWLASHYPYVTQDQWAVMPNHFHGIIVISASRGGSRTAPSPKPLGGLIGAFKTVSTKRINQLRGTPRHPVWQRNYYEHVIRNEAELDRVRQYVLVNPEKWQEDTENPENLGKSNIR